MKFLDLSKAWEDLPLTCVGCDTLKPLIAFYIKPNHSDDAQRCKVCESTRHKEYASKPEVANIIKESQAIWQKANKDKTCTYSRRWQQKNGKKRAKSKTDSGICRFDRAKHRAAMMLRTPKWLTEADWAEIKRIYAQARSMTTVTGIKYEVDHVYPLRGLSVSGLHVPSNLRIITRHDNRRKSNK